MIAADTLVLAVISVGWFLILGLAGWHFAGRAFWKWADVLYYPLALFGVILLFASHLHERELANLRLNQVQAQRRLDEQQKLRPDVAPSDVGSRFLRVSHEGIMVIRDLGNACAKVFSAELKCILAEKDAKKIDSAFEGFKLPDNAATNIATSDSISAFCDRG